MSDDLPVASRIILRHLLERGQAELPGLGTLDLRVRPERHAVHPITGEPLRVPEKRVLVFVTDPEADPRLALTELDAGEDGPGS